MAEKIRSTVAAEVPVYPNEPKSEYSDYETCTFSVHISGQCRPDVIVEELLQSPFVQHGYKARVTKRITRVEIYTKSL